MHASGVKICNWPRKNHCVQVSPFTFSRWLVYLYSISQVMLKIVKSWRSSSLENKIETSFIRFVKVNLAIAKDMQFGTKKRKLCRVGCRANKYLIQRLCKLMRAVCTYGVVCGLCELTGLCKLTGLCERTDLFELAELCELTRLYRMY